MKYRGEKILLAMRRRVPCLLVAIMRGSKDQTVYTSYQLRIGNLETIGKLRFVIR